MRRRLTGLAAALALCFAAGAQDAPSGPAPAPEPAPEPAGQPAEPPLDRAQLEAFVDGVVESYRLEKGIAGVTVSIVDRDGALLQKGYGLAKLDPEAPVDPKATLFRIGSISKTFAYVLAMKLAEAGKLDLEADANRYLPDALKIADDGFGTVRVLDLMQHTAGFEDSALGHLFVDDPAEALPTEAYLAKWRPKRVRKAGGPAVYSNYGVGLLGVIVARGYGAPFEDVAERELSRPLGMEAFTFREPGLPDGDPRKETRLKLEAWSDGFERKAGWFEKRKFEVIAQISAAGGASASAEAMTRWMRMLLNGGTLDGATILSPAAFAELSEVTYRNAPASSGLAHGFFRTKYGRYESLEHGGATLFFHSNMVVWPEAGLGVFVSTNSDTGLDLARALPRAVIERLRPDAKPEPAPRLDPTATYEPLDVAGDYLSQRRGYRSFEALPLRLAGAMTVTQMQDGTVAASSGGETRRYVPEGDGTLRAIDGPERVTLIKDASGAIVGLAGSGGGGVSDRLGLLDTPTAFFAVMGLTLAGASLGLLGAWIRYWYGTGRGQSAIERLAGATALLAGLAWLVAWGLFAAGALPLAASSEVAVYEYPGAILPMAQTAMHVAAGLSVASLPLLILIWRGPQWSWWRRLTHAAFVLVMGAQALILWRWGGLLTPMTIAG